MIAQRDDVVPIAADLDPLLACLEAGARLHSGDLRQLLRKQSVLQGLRDGSLLRVEPLILADGVLESACQLLGAPPSLDQPQGQCPGSERQPDADDQDDPRELLWKRAGQRLARSYDQGEDAVSKRDALPGLGSPDRGIVQARHQQIRATLGGAEVDRVVEVGEGGVALKT